MQPGGQPNMQQIMEQAQKMQQQLMAAQQELTAAEVTGSAGGGLVTAVVSGTRTGVSDGTPWTCSRRAAGLASVTVPVAVTPKT